MEHIEMRFSIISEPAGFALLIDEVTSCITDDKIYGTVATPLSVDEALALGGRSYPSRRRGSGQDQVIFAHRDQCSPRRGSRAGSTKGGGG